MDSKTEDGVGTVVACLMRWGTLRPDDFVVSGLHYAHIRALLSSTGVSQFCLCALCFCCAFRHASLNQLHWSASQRWPYYRALLSVCVYGVKATSLSRKPCQEPPFGSSGFTNRLRLAQTSSRCACLNAAHLASASPVLLFCGLLLFFKNPEVPHFIF